MFMESCSCEARSEKVVTLVWSDEGTRTNGAYGAFKNKYIPLKTSNYREYERIRIECRSLTDIKAGVKVLKDLD